MQFLLLQVADSTAVADAPETLSVLELLWAGGPVFMLPLLIMSIVAVYIFVERWIKIGKAAKIEPGFMANVRQHMLTGNIQAALNLCDQDDSPIGRMVRKGIQRIGKRKHLRDIEVAIENVGKLELQKLEKNLATLATISGAAPMVGFLGTVTGMIQAFYKLSTAGSNVDPELLAGGIYQALVTTATGLAIGIIAFIGYNILVSQVEKVVYNMELVTVEFIDFLQEPAKK